MELDENPVEASTSVEIIDDGHKQRKKYVSELVASGYGESLLRQGVCLHCVWTEMRRISNMPCKVKDSSARYDVRLLLEGKFLDR